MGLENLARRLHLIRTPDETLRIFIQPKSTVGVGLVNAGEENVRFGAFLLALENAVAELYDVNFVIKSETRRENELYQGVARDRIRYIRTTYLLDDNRTSIEYFLKNFSCSGLYNGCLTIRQKNIDLEKTGRLLNSLLKVGVLVFESSGEDSLDFEVSYHKGKQEVIKGRKLLDIVGLPSPSVGCRFYCEPELIGWVYVRDAPTRASLRVVH